MDNAYFDLLKENLEDAWSVAEQARSKGLDPEETVEIKRSEDMAGRTEMFLEIDGLADAIRDLQDEDYDREEICFQITDKFISGELGGFDDNEQIIEYSIRSALAILTEAVVAAPIEGLQEIEIRDDNPDGSEYIKVRYGGPIRAAGGTAQVISVIIAEYCRQKLGISEFKPTDEEVERYVEEIDLYDYENSLQYKPSGDEIRTIIENVPVMLDAEPVTEEEVSGYRDMERIDTNSGRGGMCLVVGEGIALKVPKIQKYTDQLGLNGWGWLTELPNASHVDDSDEEDEEDGEDDHDYDDKHTKNGRFKPKPKSKYKDDTLTAGRTILGHPSEQGNFRLRYGRARNIGHAAGGVSPATMRILDDYIAPGTQLKTERPGKAIAAAPVDGIDGPTVKTKDGQVIHVDDEEHAEEIRDDVEEILDLGEIAIPFGEFIENNSQLVPASYTHDWWAQEAEKAGLEVKGMPQERLNFPQVKAMAQKYDIPLHPKYTYMWHDITLDEFQTLSKAIENATTIEDGFAIPDEHQEIVEKLLVQHNHNRSEERLEFTGEEADSLQFCTDVNAHTDAEHIMEAVSEAAGITIREKAPTRIGTRMGRPEKSDIRTFERNLAVHGLYPAGRQVHRRLLDAADTDNMETDSFNDENNEQDQEESLEQGEIEVQLATRECIECDQETFRTKCPDCDERTIPYAKCSQCSTKNYLDDEDMGETDCKECGNEKVTGHRRKPLNIKKDLQRAMNVVGERKHNLDGIKGVEGLVSQEKVPELLEKVVLRKKHGLSVFEDGTSRYDATDLPLTSFKPKEIGTSVELLHELGYEKDLDGNPLEDEDQLVELKIQDLVLPKKSQEFLMSVANFIDDLFVDVYDMEPYYDADKPEDLIGSLIVGLAPHTSAGVLGRVIGFTDVLGQYAHPFFHAAKRRNCFHPETNIEFRNDGYWSETTIEQLVKNNLSDNPEKDDYGSVYSEPENEIYVRSITDSRKEVIKPVTKVQKTPAPDHLITFELETGEQVTVTPDHGMLVCDEENSMEKAPARDVSEGQSIPVENENHGCESGVSSIINKTVYKTDVEYVYNLEVKDTHKVAVEGLMTQNCDSDEDSFMLLMDALVNYSEHYLNHHRSGWSMDEPIVMNQIIDPTEIDDEAHNVDIVDEYPFELYEKSMHGADYGDVDIEIAEDRLDDPTGFRHSLTTTDIGGGPEQTTYKTLPDMQTKIDTQLWLSEAVRGTDEVDVVEKVVDGHFLADLKGNLRAFGTQEMRCTNCNTKHRRPPLEGGCRNCGQDSIILTVFEGSVDKYLDNMRELSWEYDVTTYLAEVIDEYDRSIESLFQNDHNKQAGLDDFM